MNLGLFIHSYLIKKINALLHTSIFNTNMVYPVHLSCFVWNMNAYGLDAGFKGSSLWEQTESVERLSSLSEPARPLLWFGFIDHLLFYVTVLFCFSICGRITAELFFIFNLLNGQIL